MFQIAINAAATLTVCRCISMYRLLSQSSSPRVLPAIVAAFKTTEKPDLLKLCTLANVHKCDSTYLSYFTHPNCPHSLFTGLQNGWAKMSPSTPPQSESYICTCLHSPVQHINGDRRVLNFPYLLLARLYDAYWLTDELNGNEACKILGCVRKGTHYNEIGLATCTPWRKQMWIHCPNQCL